MAQNLHFETHYLYEPSQLPPTRQEMHTVSENCSKIITTSEYGQPYHWHQGQDVPHSPAVLPDYGSAWSYYNPTFHPLQDSHNVGWPVSHDGDWTNLDTPLFDYNNPGYLPLNTDVQSASPILNPLSFPSLDLSATPAPLVSDSAAFIPPHSSSPDNFVRGREQIYLTNNSFTHYGDHPQMLFPTPAQMMDDSSKSSREVDYAPSVEDSPSSEASTPSSHDTPAQQYDAESPPLSALSREREPRHPSPESKRYSQKQRKQCMEFLAESIGFNPTSPDDITTHDKKRYYLEYIEHYVVFLHEQLRIIGKEPVPMERVSTYSGFGSRSMRTLLVHLEATLKKRQQKLLDEENTFLELTNEIIRRGGDPAAALEAAADRSNVGTAGKDGHSLPNPDHAAFPTYFS